jgi:ATP-dependent RNA helicase DHX8/PRP22
LKGQTSQSINLEPVRVIKNPNGSMQRAALTSSSLAKDRKELREQQRNDVTETVPAGPSRNWEDPMADPGSRYLAQDLRGLNKQSEETLPDWKRSMGQNLAFGKVFADFIQFLPDL